MHESAVASPGSDYTESVVETWCGKSSLLAAFEVFEADVVVKEGASSKRLDRSLRHKAAGPCRIR